MPVCPLCLLRIVIVVMVIKGRCIRICSQRVSEITACAIVVVLGACCERSFCYCGCCGQCVPKPAVIICAIVVVLPTSCERRLRNCGCCGGQCVSKSAELIKCVTKATVIIACAIVVVFSTRCRRRFWSYGCSVLHVTSVNLI